MTKSDVVLRGRVGRPLMSATAKSNLPVAQRLKITEVFLSLQGEAATAGLPTAFLRLTGCPLRCQYCDTAYAFHGGRWLDFEQIMTEIGGFGVTHVCVTGGEPLAQKNCRPLLERLCDAGYAVSLETSGAFDISELDPRVVRVMDLKTPGSGETDRNLWSNLAHLRPDDIVKFVVCDRADYEWVRVVVEREDLVPRCQVFLSPSWSQIQAAELADWILEDRLPVRLQVQLHKILWGETPGR